MSTDAAKKAEQLRKLIEQAKAKKAERPATATTKKSTAAKPEPEEEKKPRKAFSTKPAAMTGRGAPQKAGSKKILQAKEVYEAEEDDPILKSKIKKAKAEIESESSSEEEEIEPREVLAKTKYTNHMRRTAQRPIRGRRPAKAKAESESEESESSESESSSGEEEEEGEDGSVSDIEEEDDERVTETLTNEQAEREYERLAKEKDQRQKRQTWEMMIDKIKATWVSPDELEANDEERPKLTKDHFIGKGRKRFEEMSAQEVEGEDDWKEYEEEEREIEKQSSKKARKSTKGR